MLLLQLFYIMLYSVAVTGSREKRLVLHSETDITQELVKLQTELHNEIHALKDELKLHKDELQILKDELQHDHGSVYVRWGRTTCQQNGTSLIYKGYMAGKLYTHAGAGTNSLCLPEDPTWGKYQDGPQTSRAHIYGTEFQEADNVIFGKDVMDEDIPCAVCQVPKVSIMIPARVDCYPGWKIEYTGYLMAAVYTHNALEYACVDGDPEFITRGSSDTDGHLMYLVEGGDSSFIRETYFARAHSTMTVVIKNQTGETFLPSQRSFQIDHSGFVYKYCPLQRRQQVPV